MLSKVDIFDIRNNCLHTIYSICAVVNCSQKLISLIFGTTFRLYFVSLPLLWIALKSWYLWYSEQPCGLGPLACYCCELLSKVDIFDIRNNQQNILKNGLQLWIALKSWYLWYSEQQVRESGCYVSSCELLSKVDIFDIRNNQDDELVDVDCVVNCSQKLISLIFGTTEIDSAPFVGGCELLSKVDIFDIRNNERSEAAKRALVVNCSQKLISLIFGTTSCKKCIISERLWIALKSWYLWYSEQLLAMIIDLALSCELLSKVDIFDIRNNY